MVVIPIINNGSVSKTCRYLFALRVSYPLFRIHHMAEPVAEFGYLLRDVAHEYGALLVSLKLRRDTVYGGEGVRLYFATSPKKAVFSK